MSALRTVPQRSTSFAFVVIVSAVFGACRDNTAPASTEPASPATSQTPSHGIVNSESRGANPCLPLCAAPRILFDRGLNGSPHVFRMNSDGSNVTLVGEGSEPAWSPNYQKIAFVKGGSRDVHVMNANGTNVVQLTFTGDLEGSPTWSPDGTKIAYSRNYGSSSEIFVMNANGTGQTRLTYHTADDFLPAWSPDGSRIAFVRSGTIDADIMVMNSDGSSQIALTGPSQLEWAPAWSPDGSTIAYTVAGAGCTIALMNPDGTNQTMLGSIPGISNCTGPTFSVSGNQLAFRSFSPSTLKGSIYAMDLTSGVVSHLTSGLRSDSHPAWSRQ